MRRGGGAPQANGIASKSPAAILSAMQRATRSLRSVHIKGSLVSGGQTLGLDLDLLAGRGGHGRMSQNGAAFTLVAIGHVVYVNASDAFWRAHGGTSAVISLFKGKWLKVTTNTSGFASLSQLMNIQKLTGTLAATKGTITKGATSTVNGVKAIALIDKAKGGTLYVAATGPPYPVEIVKTGKNGGRLIFDRYDEQVSLSVPASSIDLSALTGG